MIELDGLMAAAAPVPAGTMIDTAAPADFAAAMAAQQVDDAAPDTEAEPSAEGDDVDVAADVVSLLVSTPSSVAAATATSHSLPMTGDAPALSADDLVASPVDVDGHALESQGASLPTGDTPAALPAGEVPPATTNAASTPAESAGAFESTEIISTDLVRAEPLADTGEIDDSVIPELAQGLADEGSTPGSLLSELTGTEAAPEVATSAVAAAPTVVGAATPARIGKRPLTCSRATVHRWRSTPHRPQTRPGRWKA